MWGLFAGIVERDCEMESERVTVAEIAHSQALDILGTAHALRAVPAMDAVLEDKRNG
jgi:hypothetical protein